MGQNPAATETDFVLKVGEARFHLPSQGQMGCFLMGTCSFSRSPKTTVGICVNVLSLVDAVLEIPVRDLIRQSQKALQTSNSMTFFFVDGKLLYNSRALPLSPGGCDTCRCRWW